MHKENFYDTFEWINGNVFVVIGIISRIVFEPIAV